MTASSSTTIERPVGDGCKLTTGCLTLAPDCDGENSVETRRTAQQGGEPLQRKTYAATDGSASSEDRPARASSSMQLSVERLVERQSCRVFDGAVRAGSR